MSENRKFRDVVVRAIIGDIRVALSSDDLDEIGSDPLTDEEIAEFEAFDEPNQLQFSQERLDKMQADAMKIMRWVLYKQEMEKRGLTYLDRHEYMNMAVEPTVPTAPDAARGDE